MKTKQIFLLCIALLGFAVQGLAQNLIPSVGVNNVIRCFGGTDCSASASATGGTPPYTYSWSTGEVTQTVNNLSAGIYSVIVSDAAGATQSVFFNVTQPTAISVGVTAITSISCAGGANGQATAVATGGIPPYTYTWDNGFSNPNNSLSAGTHTVTATDGNGCTGSGTFVITEPSPPVLFTNSGSVTCFGGTDGFGSVNVAGGTSPYTYSLNVGIVNTTGVFTGLSAGNYNTTVSDANGCIISGSFFISSPGPISINATTTQNVSCFGGADGDAFANVTGGTPPYSFTWDNGVVSISNNSLSAGTHTVTATDSHGCSASASVTIAQPSQIVLTMNQTNAICAGSATGSADAFISGGRPPFSYTWSNNSFSQSLNNISAGIYTVTVSDANNCTASASVFITAPSSMSITASLNSPSTTCEGNGSVVLSSSGGNAPYTFAMNNSSRQNSTIFAGLHGGTYTFLAFDVQGCSVSIIVTVPENIPSPCVFPGDANNDGTADNTDLLPIALSNALTGNARVSASTQWTAQTAQNWTTNIPNTTTNRKHADCDGNGTILANDTLVILQNYGQTHALRTPQTTNQNDPPISCVFASDTIQNVSYPYNLKASVMVGSSAIQAQNVHGLAFTINYDATIASSAYFNLKNVSWLGNANELYHLQHDDGAGHLDVAISRFDGQPRNGAGIVAECGFVIIDNVIGRGVNSISAPFNVSISDIKAISPQNMTLPMSGIATQTVLKNMVLGTNNNPLSANIRISPNPTDGILNIQSNGIVIHTLTLTNIVGQVLISQKTFDNNTNPTLSLSHLPQGTYLLTIDTPQGSSTRKIVRL
jgi:SprB repeat/Secretion system C-terminal sorting domain